MQRGDLVGLANRRVVGADAPEGAMATELAR